MAKLLVTRPREQAEALADRLRTAGHDVIIDPMLGIRFLDIDLPPLDGVQAILLTSRNGARALAQSTERRDVAILAVGDATAEAARAEGFASVQSAEGDAEDLIALASRVLSPSEGRVVHVSGFDIAEDVAAALAARGFEAARIPAYEAETASRLSSETQSALRAEGLDAVLLHSPRAAKTFAALVESGGLADRLNSVNALVLSEQVAAAVRQLPWRDLRVAARPTEEALLELIDAKPEPVAVSEPRIAVPASPPESGKTKGGGLLACLLAGLLGGAAAGAAAAWLLLPPPATSPPGDTGALSARLSELERAVDAVRTAPAPAPTSQVDLGPLEARIATLESRPEIDLRPMEQRLSALESRPASTSEAIPAPATPATDLTPRLEATERQLDAIAERLKANAPREGEAARIALVLAVAELGEVVRSGAPYVSQMQAVESLLGPARAVAQPLAATAETGVPTPASLQERFPAIARGVMTAAASGDGEGWLDHVRARLASAVVVRRTGDVAGDTPEALVARAEAKLRQNDAAGAAAEIGKLTGRPAEAAADWLSAARALTRAEATLAALKRHAVQAAGGARR